MIHIFWSGKGFLVAAIVFGSSLCANAISNWVTGGSVYWDTHKWPFAVSLFASSVACWFAARALSNKCARVPIDQDRRRPP
jgi:hypothetical protein